MPKKIPTEIRESDYTEAFPPNIDEITQKESYDRNVLVEFELSSIKDIRNIINAISSMTSKVSMNFYRNRVELVHDFTGRRGIVKTVLYPCLFANYYCRLIEDSDEFDNIGVIVEASDLLSTVRQNKNQYDSFIFILKINEEGEKIIKIVVKHLQGEMTSEYEFNSHETPEMVVSNEEDDEQYSKVVIFSIQRFENIMLDIAQFDEKVRITISDEQCMFNTDSITRVRKRITTTNNKLTRIIENNNPGHVATHVQTIATFLKPKKCFNSVRFVFLRCGISCIKVQYRMPTIGQMDLYLIEEGIN